MRSPGTDRALSIGATVLFSFALGTLGVVVPLLAIGVGYSAPEVGLMVALAAVSQLVTRLFIGALMRRVPDKAFLVGSAVMIAVSCVLLALSDALVIFAVSQLVQGSARALFWTSSQTHAVRMSATSVGGLTAVNLAAGVGALLGPALAGYLWEASAALPLVVAAAAGAAAAIPAALLVRLPLFAPGKSAGGMKAGRLWRRPGVGAACWMNAGAGAWKSLLDSYVPVALSLAGQSVAVIGILISIANTAVLAGSAAGSWLRRKGVRASLVTGLLATGAGLAAAGPLAGVAAAAAGASLSLALVRASCKPSVRRLLQTKCTRRTRGCAGTDRHCPCISALLYPVWDGPAGNRGSGCRGTARSRCSHHSSGGVRHTEGRAASPRGAATTGPFHPFATRTPESSREEGIR